jgi:hypothetical protein
MRRILLQAARTHPSLETAIDAEIERLATYPKRTMPTETFIGYPNAVMAALSGVGWSESERNDHITYLQYLVDLFMEITSRCRQGGSNLAAHATKVNAIAAMCEIIEIVDRAPGELGENLRENAAVLSEYVVAVACTLKPSASRPSDTTDINVQGPIQRLLAVSSNSPRGRSIARAAGIDKAVLILSEHV